VRPTRWPVRVRLAALYAGAFLAAGVVLIAVSYSLVSMSLEPIEHREAPGDLHRPAAGIEAGPTESEREVVEAYRSEALSDLLTWSLLALAGALVLAVVLGWLLAGRALRPLRQVTETANRVADRSLHERIALEGPDDEVKELADTVDAMLERLDRSFDAQRRFVANASHELRTPLTTNRTLLEVALGDPDVSADLKRLAPTLLTTNERSERLIDALLALARADQDDHPRVEVDLSELVRHLTDETDLDGLRLELTLRPARVLGDRELLRTMTANLIDNAVRHNTSDGWIEIRTDSAGDEARLELSNSGATIAAEEAAALTEPFRRLGTARTGNGHGLGLSIAASVAHAHGGQLAIEPLERGGLRVSIRLPAATVSRDRSDGDLRPSRAPAPDSNYAESR
jgi:signal transduction histidine kinase